MKIICPVTKKKCPYLKKLETDLCHREHECDQVKDFYAGITKKPPSKRKRILIAGLIIIIISTVLICFLIFKDFIFKNNNAGPSDSSDASGIVISTTQKPSFEPLPTPSPLPAIPTTDVQATAPARLTIGSVESEIISVPLDSNSMIKVEQSPSVLSWYQGSSIPGQSGNCIIFGYKYYNGIVGVFHSLDSLKLGDSLTFTLDNGTRVSQTVYDIRVYRGGILDSDVLSIDFEGLRSVLISETGAINPNTGQYEDLVALFLN